MADLTDLIARLQAAEGPDRGLDAEIAAAVGWTHVGKRDGYKDIIGFMPGRPSVTRIPRFTSSMDSAFQLIPERADFWELFDDCGAYFARIKECGPGAEWKVIGETDAGYSSPALALCIACLKARVPASDGGG
jgi:hypothetical protein